MSLATMAGSLSLAKFTWFIRSLSLGDVVNELPRVIMSTLISLLQQGAVTPTQRARGEGALAPPQ